MLKMQTRILYQAASGVHYELTILHDEDQYVPSVIGEEISDDRIYDLTSDRSWDSLMHMTNDLEVEIIACESEVGN